MIYDIFHVNKNAFHASKTTAHQHNVQSQAIGVTRNSLTMAASIRDEEDDQGIFTNKSTMMANFEEWIKMATDNKINSRNSWNFALIDYFHDLNVLKDAEDNINFQKASATLDGCVKIYSSRVDSVANETGKLLSGLAERRNQEHNAHNAGADDGQGNEQEESVTIDPATGLPISNDVDSTTRRRNYNRILETTLVEFETLRMKELDQELSIDPLFKKALADFDEGGAKSLLLNTLHIDNTARVVFDATTNNKDNGRPTTQQPDDSQDEIQTSDENEVSNSGQESVLPEASSASINRSKDESAVSVDVDDEILALGMDLIDFHLISQCQLCPSMQQLKGVVEDISKAKSFIEDVNNKFDNFLTEQDLQEAVPDNAANDDNEFETSYDNDINVDDGLFDDGDAQSASVPREEDISMADEDKSTVDIITNVMDKELMSYFDESLKKSWRGREHWKVRSFKKRVLSEKENDGQGKNEKAKPLNKDKDTSQSAKAVNKNQTIDFFNISNDIEETIFSTKKKANLEMPQKLRTNPSHYLLPNDYQFSTQKVTRLFIKPEQHMSFFSHRKSRSNTGSQGTFKIDDFESVNNDQVSEIADENFWAKNYRLREEDQAAAENGDASDNIHQGVMDNPFDDNDGGIDFNQAFGSEGMDDYPENSTDSVLAGSAGALQEVGKTNLKVPYSRVSKKVDVKRLKDNIWKSIVETVNEEDFKESKDAPQSSDDTSKHNSSIEEDDPEKSSTIKFTDIANKISTIYSGESKKDLSTSFCFICLLHLANEHGFQISNNDNFDDLKLSINELKN